MSLITLDEARSQLGIGNGDVNDDGLLASYVEGATAAVEAYLGEVVDERSCTDYIHADGSGRMLLQHTPVISLTSITSAADSSTTWDVGDHKVLARSGVVLTTSGPNPVGIVEVVYQAGYATPPENYRLAALVILQHNWETQRGVGSLGGGVIGPEERMISSTYAIPRKALEWLGPATPAVA
ncbi:MAG TPA: phage head-tail connector protein [Nocardioidaceae bacterium]|nr:phage head-tail connector protein [Nocardioidaceae bacterium]